MNVISFLCLLTTEPNGVCLLQFVRCSAPCFRDVCEKYRYYCPNYRQFRYCIALCSALSEWRCRNVSSKCGIWRGTRGVSKSLIQSAQFIESQTSVVLVPRCCMLAN